MIRVLVVATAAVARAGLSVALSIDPEIEVVGTAADLETLAAAVDRSQPDAILLDLGDSPQASLWEQLTLLQAGRAARIPIALYDWDGDLQVAFQAGVRGILPDTSTEIALGAAMVAIARGWLVLPPTAIELFNAREQVAAPSTQILTSREIEVLVQIGAGLANKAIAQNLHISDHTVKFHISSIFQKLHVSTRTEAVKVGIGLGLILF
ncbi:response regulator transcription factor [Chamaesiphon sp. OTE_75_metabat_556]|uniref:response regulator transcription factor n=1 Tax=Chamaesiphon sp. OTE_75_metabat_556 TaxID=2964692 RepID=UPI00286ACAC1|nr:response regulator transcription factor [Chamaesiphon sp. OTE_75_metabat_556]